MTAEKLYRITLGQKTSDSLIEYRGVQLQGVTGAWLGIGEGAIGGVTRSSVILVIPAYHCEVITVEPAGFVLLGEEGENAPAD